MEFLGFRVVDDEWVVAAQHAVALKKHGAIAIGPVGNLASALEAAEGEVLDCALLDFSMDGEAVTPADVALAKRGIPIALVTGYGSSMDLPAGLNEVLRIEKPASPEILARAVAGRLRGANSR